jgi:PAS domain S-box-containing protein
LKTAHYDHAYRLLFEHNPLPMWVYDRETLRFLEVNEAAVRQYEFSRDEFLVMTIRDIRPLDEMPALEADLRQGKTGYDPPMEWRHRRKNGDLIYVEISAHDIEHRGRPARLVLAKDVTERRRQEDALRRFNQRLQTLWQIDKAILAAQAPAEIAGAAVERIVALAPGCVRASLMESTDDGWVVLAAHADSELVRSLAPDPSALELLDVEALRRGDPSPVPDASSSPGVGSLVAVPLLSDDRLVAVLILEFAERAGYSDETIEIAGEVATQLAVALQQARLRVALERHTATLEAKVAERTRELAETNAELESFAYSVSHDLRAPLRAMQGFSQALLEDYALALGDEGRDYAGRIVAAARRMDELIRGLLAYSRLTREEMHLRPVSLDAVVEAARSQLAADLADRNVEVRVEEPLGRVVGHHGTLVQVVANLVSNAAKFVPAERRPRVWIDSQAGNGEIRLRVRDNGIGIEPQYRERIFRVFERLHSSERFSGTGIGLSIVRKGVERMGGRIELESTPGEGSTFSVLLPSIADAR